MSEDSFRKVAGDALFGFSQAADQGGKELSPPTWDEELRIWLTDYIAKYPHHTTGVLSHMQYIGVARTVLDAYIGGTYFRPRSEGGQGVNPAESKIEHAIRLYRQRVEGSERHGYTNPFVETRVWLQLKQACLAAMKEHVIVVVYGRPGVGKSRCLIEFCLREMTVAPVSIMCSRNVTARYLLSKLAESLRIYDGHSTAHLEEVVAEKLKRTPRPIMIDQANYLCERALGSICFIWEIARVPIVLIGTKDLYNLFNSSKLREDIKAQLASRVALHYLLPELDLSEAKGIIERALKENANDEAVAQIYSVTGGIHRHVDMILPRILELKAINETKLLTGQVKMSDLIRTAASRLMTG
jgi:DNA transposition AAA+ family ATPase